MTNWKQFLTEQVLKGCWHNIEDRGPFKSKCRKCGMSFGAIHTSDWNPQGFNRTFDNRSDLLDLYEAIYRDGKWDKLQDHLFSLWDDLFPLQKDTTTFTPWLFCLDGKGYEERCKMIAEFYGWEGREMKTTPMMKCGHAANAINKKGEPCCVICIGIHPGASAIDEHPASLENRQAKCACCQSKVVSSPELAFFESCPNKSFDSYYCGCKGWD